MKPIPVDVFIPPSPSEKGGYVRHLWVAMAGNLAVLVDPTGAVIRESLGRLKVVRYHIDFVNTMDFKDPE